jgi:hypothetical protein
LSKKNSVIYAFNRIEKKYLISAAQFERITQRLREYTIADSYGGNDGRYHVNSLYYDTPDRVMIRRSLEKPYYKEKLRLRSYGTYAPGGTVFAEIKKKVYKMGNKRRIALSADTAHEFLTSGFLPREEEHNTSAQITAEIRTLLMRYDLKLAPSVLLSYDRMALIGKDDDALRISFDKELFAQSGVHTFADQDLGERLISEEQVIMEIKTNYSIPLWLASVLSEEKVYPCGFSKYGQAYLNELAHKKEKLYVG